MIVLSLLLLSFVLIRWKRRRTRYTASSATPRDAERAQRQRERDEKQRQREAIAAEKAAAKKRKETAERQQAAADKDFYISQLDKMYSLLWETDTELERARQTCRHDTEANRAGAVVADKIVNKHYKERESLEKKVMQLERSIHATETKLNKAQQIAENH